RSETASELQPWHRGRKQRTGSRNRADGEEHDLKRSIEVFADRGAVYRGKLVEILGSLAHDTLENSLQRTVGASDRKEDDRADHCDPNCTPYRTAQRHGSDRGAQRLASSGLLHGHLHRGHHHPEARTG